MTVALWLTLMRGTWLTLASMMLLSRFAFQWAGPIRMRAFLDQWKVSTTHRVWGLSSFLLGLVMLVATVALARNLELLDQLFGVMLLVVLMGDGFLNFAPSGFSRFKEQVQDLWVRRHRGTDPAGDQALFGTVNLFLGLASVAMAVVIILYRPIEPPLILLAVSLAVILTAVLILTSSRESGELRYRP